jgi:hypothetical protein
MRSPPAPDKLEVFVRRSRQDPNKDKTIGADLDHFGDGRVGFLVPDDDVLAASHTPGFFSRTVATARRVTQ